MTLVKKILERLFRRSRKKPSAVAALNHDKIFRASISANALKVLTRLKESGYSAYLVGGSVRDILLDRKPKDFDVATNAHPEAVREIFRNSRIIGRRFRLVHVFYGSEIIEVSTFRANTVEDMRSSETFVESDTEIHAETGMIHRDNTYGTIEEDAWRRDFTVNALYYDIVDGSVVDYMRGMHDLKARLIRVIGDPTQRYHEDPIRLLRTIRFAAKLNFELEFETEGALKKLPHLLQHVPSARLFDECVKLFFVGNAAITFEKLMHLQYLRTLFPELVHVMHAHKNKIYEKLISLALIATDKRFAQGDSINPGFLFAVFLWPVVHVHLSRVKNKKNKFFMQLHQLVRNVLHTQTQAMMIPKRLQFMMQAMWILQFQLEKRRPKRVMTIYKHRYFRAAFDFLGLRVQAGEIAPDDFNWWRDFQFSNDSEREKMIERLRS